LWTWSLRKDRQFMLSTWERKVSLSIRADTMLEFSKIVVHSENFRLVETMTLCFSARSDTTLKSNSDWCLLKVRYDISSIIKRSALISCFSSFINFLYSWASTSWLDRFAAVKNLTSIPVMQALRPSAIER